MGRGSVIANMMKAVEGQEKVARRRRLVEQEKGWWEFVSRPDSGFLINKEKPSGVTLYLEKKYAETREKYLNGEVELVDVHTAFSDYMKSTRRNYFVNQLEGTAYIPSPDGGRRVPGRLIQELFETGNRGVDRVIRKTATPQVEAQPDQLAKMKIYFGLDPDEYAARKTVGVVARSS